jgi:hypothetical protein
MEICAHILNRIKCRVRGRFRLRTKYCTDSCSLISLDMTVEKRLNKAQN